MLPKKRPNHKNKKTVIIVVAIAAVLMSVAIIWWIVMPSDEQESGLVSGQESVQTLETDDETSVVKEESTDSCVEDTSVSDTEVEKEYYVDYVELAALYNGDGIFDIHIRFPDGEDYVVVAGKNITDVTDEGFYIRLNDRENHMLSSARTDMDVYSGTQMYLSRYESDRSVESKADYPWNQFVLGAHGTKEAEASEIYAKRSQLEENLATFMNQTLSK